jgi:hypothetical protein
VLIVQRRFMPVLSPEPIGVSLAEYHIGGIIFVNGRESIKIGLKYIIKGII